MLSCKVFSSSDFSFLISVMWSKHNLDPFNNPDSEPMISLSKQGTCPSVSLVLVSWVPVWQQVWRKQDFDQQSLHLWQCCSSGKAAFLLANFNFATFAACLDCQSTHVLFVLLANFVPFEVHTDVLFSWLFLFSLSFLWAQELLSLHSSQVQEQTSFDSGQMQHCWFLLLTGILPIGGTPSCPNCPTLMGEKVGFFRHIWCESPMQQIFGLRKLHLFSNFATFSSKKDSKVVALHHCFFFFWVAQTLEAWCAKQNQTESNGEQLKSKQFALRKARCAVTTMAMAWLVGLTRREVQCSIDPKNLQKTHLFCSCGHW